MIQHFATAFSSRKESTEGDTLNWSSRYCENKQRNHHKCLQSNACTQIRVPVSLGTHKGVTFWIKSVEWPFPLSFLKYVWLVWRPITEITSKVNISMGKRTCRAWLCFHTFTLYRTATWHKKQHRLIAFKRKTLCNW